MLLLLLPRVIGPVQSDELLILTEKCFQAATEQTRFFIAEIDGILKCFLSTDISAYPKRGRPTMLLIPALHAVCRSMSSDWYRVGRYARPFD